MKSDIAVVGAGPTALALAAELCRRGITTLMNFLSARSQTRYWFVESHENNMSHTFETRINLADPALVDVMKAMYGLEQPLNGSTLEPALRELVKVRASQINRCAYCLDMHTKDARAQGESEQRLYALSAWREAPFYSNRERAALEWTEHVTLISEKEISDELFARMREFFTDEELILLTLAVVQINGWNRFAISFRAPAGTYQPSQRHAADAIERVS